MVSLDENIRGEQQLIDKHADAAVDLPLSPVGNDAAGEQGAVNMRVDHVSGLFFLPRLRPEHVPHFLSPKIRNNSSSLRNFVRMLLFNELVTFIEGILPHKSG